jgi:hypothetical protein
MEIKFNKLYIYHDKLKSKYNELSIHMNECLYYGGLWSIYILCSMI